MQAMDKDAGDLHLHTYPLPRKQQPAYASMTRGVRAVVRAGEPIVTFSARVDLHTPRKPISAKGMGKSRQRVGAHRLPSPLRVRWSVSAAGVPTSISGGATCTRQHDSSASNPSAVWLLRCLRRVSPLLRSCEPPPCPSCSPPALGARACSPSCTAVGPSECSGRDVPVVGRSNT